MSGRREAGESTEAGAHDREFAAFMRASATRLFRLAFLLTGDRHRAEDLTQDALSRTYGVWRRVVRDDAYAYTRRVLVNLHADWWRARMWRERLVDQPQARERVPDPATEVVRRDMVIRALRELTRRERAVVVLRYFADLSEAEVAGELNISVGTVKSTNARALRKLRVAADLTEPLAELRAGHRPGPLSNGEGK